jgi:hypothetical protein
MHKNIEVVQLIIDEDAVAITEIGEVLAPDHLPLGVYKLTGDIDRREMNDWLKGRSIPASRFGIWDLYTSLGRDSTEYLILKCYGLSLSDHYWVRPEDSGLHWGDINFFQNDFSKDVGEMLFGREPDDKKNVSLVSPDNTSDGWLRKKWIISDGKRTLVKGGSGIWKQEPYNEVVATAIMRRLEMNHVPYSLITERGEPLCLCENFLSEDTELVTAWRVLHSHKMEPNDTDFSHFLRCCDKLCIPNARRDLEKMIVLDYIIANEDRHYSNFGFVRNAETLQWLGVAPIFDSGTSLWHNAHDITEVRKCQPFAKTHEEQLELVSDLGWFNIEALNGLENEIATIFSKSHMDKDRIGAIANTVIGRVKRIEHRARSEKLF